MNSKSVLALVLVAALSSLSVGCGGGKRRAEHARAARTPSSISGPSASQSSPKRCQIAGFAYAVPAPAPIMPASAVVAPIEGAQ